MTTRLDYLVEAARQFVGGDWSEEVARNVATVLTCDEATGTSNDPMLVALDALKHRSEAFSVEGASPLGPFVCEDLHGCASTMGRAWVVASGGVVVVD